LTERPTQASDGAAALPQQGPRQAFLFGPLTPIGLLTAGLAGLLDQVSKLWLIFVFGLERRGLVPLLPGLDLVLVWNTGISYGLLQQETALGRGLLLGFKLVAVGLLWVWLARAASGLAAVALGLIIGGALGNAIDALAYGAVADFIYLHATFGSWEFRWYVFNLADAAIVAGVIGLLYDSLFVQGAAKAP
jgi:signal peptidase II